MYILNCRYCTDLFEILFQTIDYVYVYERKGKGKREETKDHKGENQLRE